MYCDGTVSTSCAMEMDLPGYRRPKDEMQTFEDKGVGSGATLVSPKKVQETGFSRYSKAMLSVCCIE